MNNYEWRAERDGKFENQGEMRKNKWQERMDRLVRVQRPYYKRPRGMREDNSNSPLNLVK